MSARGLNHQGLVYDTDEQFLMTTVPFCRDGLDRDDAVLAVTTTANIDHLRDSLGGDADRIEFVDSAVWYDAPGRTLAAYHRYVTERSDRRIRIIGEPVWEGRDALEAAEWTRYESVINLAFADSAAWIVCPYDARVVPAAVVDDARRTHPDLVDGPVTEFSPAYVAPDLFDGGIRGSTESERDHEPVLRFTEDLAAVRRFVATVAASLGVSPERVGSLVMAVNEVASNALEHGGGSGRITLHRAGHRIVCDVTDDSPNATVDWFAGYQPPDPAQPRGHGLWVARQLTEFLQIHPTATGTTVRLHHRAA